MVIAERHHAGDFPAGGGDVGFESIGTRDAGHEEHARRGRHDDRIARAGHHAGRADRARDAEHGRQIERAADPLRRRGVAGVHERRVRGRRRRQPLAQASGRERMIAQIVLGHEQQVDVPRQLEILKAVVQNVDCGAEPTLGEAA